MAQTREQKAVVKRWIKNLRSGEYLQGQGALVTRNSKVDMFCCLGVLTDMAARDKVIPLPVIVYLEGLKTLQYEDKVTGTLPEEVRKWVGLKDKAGAFDIDSLADMNDAGWTFEMIADFLESPPDDLFV